jgi:hypothetical protein
MICEFSDKVPIKRLFHQEKTMSMAVDGGSSERKGVWNCHEKQNYVSHVITSHGSIRWVK